LKVATSLLVLVSILALLSTSQNVTSLMNAAPLTTFEPTSRTFYPKTTEPKTTTVPPQPIISHPRQGETYQVGEPVTLQGYAKSTDPGNLLGWTPCNQMQWTGTGANQFQMTPAEGSNYQQTGVCETAIIFSSSGSQTITLDAWNKLDQHGHAEVTININKASAGPQSSDFDLTVSPTTTRVIQGSSTTFAVTVSPTTGPGEPVTLSASQVQGATINFSPNSRNLPYTSELTIKTSTQTPPKTYTITIEGTQVGVTGGTVTHTATITLEVDPIPQ